MLLQRQKQLKINYTAPEADAYYSMFFLFLHKYSGAKHIIPASVQLNIDTMKISLFLVQ